MEPVQYRLLGYTVNNLLPWVVAATEVFNGGRGLEEYGGVAIVTGEAVPADIKVGELWQ